MAKRKRRPTTFNLSFLDIMSCGFGAVVLFFMIINHATKDHNERINRDLISETNLLEKRVELGKRNLAEIRNELQETDSARKETEGKTDLVIEELDSISAELSELDKTTIARKESINKLKADLKSIEEEQRRLSGSVDESDNKGDSLRTVLGAGDRLYLTGLKVGGERVLFLIDASASMLDETIVNVLRRRNMSDQAKRDSEKWQRVLGSVEWLVAKMPVESQFQMFTFNQLATPTVADSRGRWLSADDAEEVNSAVEGLEEVVPGRGTSLYRAFEVVNAMNPPPDNIYLITDGLPTMADSVPVLSKVSGRKRMRHFSKALNVLPSNIPVNVILFPMEGDPRAASAYWRLVQLTGGSYIAPASDWP
ncbi:MAG: VWA domain-containing protein [Gammaproteobacteria bacterium]